MRIYTRPHPTKGRKLPPRSAEWCRKISERKKGSIPWNKGKKGVQVSWRKGKKLNIKMSEEVRKKMSESRKGVKNHFYGKHHSEKAKQLIRDARLGKPQKYSKQGLENKINASKNRIWTEESRNKIKNKRKNWVIPFKDTKPEKMMQIALALNGIKFEKHKPFKLGKLWHQVDIFIEPNICVEIDGVHWHLEDEDVKRDLFQTQELTVMGYHIIRIRDKDILKNTQNCAEMVIKLIKELDYKFKLYG